MKDLTSNLQSDGSKSYLFIVGCPRSGTTLLSVLIDRHSNFAITPETGFFDEILPHLSYRPNDFLRLRLLQKWRRLPELKLKPEEVIDSMNPDAPPAQEMLATILNLYARNNSKARCGEKTPQHLKNVPTILRWFPSARVVCLLRDGRDTALSLYSMPWYKKNLASAGRLWLKSLHLMEKFSALYPEQFFIVGYEELVNHPEAVMNRVMNFLSETYEPRQLCTDVPSNVVLARSLDWKGKALTSVRSNTEYKTSHPKEYLFLERFLRKELLRYGYL